MAPRTLSRTGYAVAAVLLLMPACASSSNVEGEASEPPTTPVTTTEPKPTSKATTRAPEPTPEALGIAGTYSGTMVVDTYDGWYDEWEPGAPQVGDKLQSAIMLLDDCDSVDTPCTLDYTGLDPDDEVGGTFTVEDATVAVDGGSVIVSASTELIWECWEEDEYLGDVTGPIEYELRFTNKRPDGYKDVEVAYEVPPATSDYCEGHTVTSGDLARE